MPSTAPRAIHPVEHGLVPDTAIRLGVRRPLRERLTELQAGDPEATARLTADLRRDPCGAPVARVPEKANAQHHRRGVERPAAAAAHRSRSRSAPYAFVEKDDSDWMSRRETVAA